MKNIIQNINQLSRDNEYFRQVLATGKHTQVVVMSIPVGGNIGMETHKDNDQVLYFIDGEGEVILDGVRSDFKAGDLVLVEAGTEHDFINKGEVPLKIVTMYSPAHHPDGTVHKTKEEADKAGY